MAANPTPMSDNPFEQIDKAAQRRDVIYIGRPQRAGETKKHGPDETGRRADAAARAVPSASAPTRWG